NAASAQITLSLLTSGGSTIATTNQILGPGNHAAGFIAGLFPSATGPIVGTMQLRSTTPLAATALRFDVLSPAFTSVPPITIASLIGSGMEWFEKRFTPLTTVARLLGTFGIG